MVLVAHIARNAQDGLVKNIQIIDRADNATFSIFAASDEAFAAIFPDGRDIEFIEDFFARVGDEQAGAILSPIWECPVLKRDAQGVHGTLLYQWSDRRVHWPASKREVDWDARAINAAQRRLNAEHR
ncbi:hypothetical protein QH494_23890 [Sphingomonas sp. AR_OL41]|uniref:hypothetical protein n=1 Tax=Sphingomonas sp. AR_OL41 TaxID=3042729 RepID=UPI00247FFC35|nr:hypothetical protein [Sphingomonas sp. AR_OL41]MDH7975238.1 hypothetical protein [Sphingomonas sp. AR_OL41]